MPAFLHLRRVFTTSSGRSPASRFRLSSIFKINSSPAVLQTMVNEDNPASPVPELYTASSADDSSTFESQVAFTSGNDHNESTIREPSDTITTPEPVLIMNDDNEATSFSDPESSDTDVETLVHAADADEAQRIFSADACIFLGDLPAFYNDMQLKRAVENALGHDGHDVYVKIIRRSPRMPVAFAQFTKPEHAEKALHKGIKRGIFGRPCRMERAKCERAVFCVKVGAKGYLSPAQIGQLRVRLQQFGRIEREWDPTSNEVENHLLSGGRWFKFASYGAAKAACQALRHGRSIKVLFVGDHPSQVSYRSAVAAAPRRPLVHRGPHAGLREYGAWRHIPFIYGMAFADGVSNEDREMGQVSVAVAAWESGAWTMNWSAGEMWA